ncbi:MAG: transglutaminase-like domain-containing protein [Bacteroidales bacterium]|jgi:hypothetical protein|nr:transglutaminase-like domain-containing protein [Bacteroidales bacterium]
MKNYCPFLFVSIVLTVLLTSCREKEVHFLTQADYRAKVHEQFLKREVEAFHRKDALFSVFENKDLSLEQREALEFLFAYMPLSDLADYTGDFFLKQVDAAFRARDYFPWGKSIPEDVFRHFVLVYRVNNEYLDTARLVFFEALKERVKHLSMEEAALEVNHWCHEKVTYRATDGRTSSPLALVKTSWGRCGEESTFTVAAMRAVGIPARQCYTPRWVHTNSNHAWVEVWIDGTWHYLGACEPEAELDMAWFTAPAKRAMMIHTNVFGRYEGQEEKNMETDLYAKINLLANYAPTRQAKVKVVDQQNNPVEHARVQFKVYNYSEFYPIAEALTDQFGEASILTGMGDLLIWADKNGVYGYEKSTKEDKEITLVLKHIQGEEYTEDLEMNPPAEQPVKEISAGKIAENAARLAFEDSVRNAYMHTFATEQTATLLAEETGLNKDEVWKYLSLSQGNWEEITSFIRSNKDNPYLFPFLAALLEKDLRDTPAAYLQDHLEKKEDLVLRETLPDEMIVSKILSPRIALELIKPWRSFFRQKEVADKIAGKEHSVNNIIDYIKQNIKIKEEENYYNCLLTPQGVYELKMADRRSVDVFFVAVCRSLGIAAQIEEATGKPQYYQQAQWHDAVWEEQTEDKANLPKGKLTIVNDKSNFILPEYTTHYTLAYFRDGDFSTLNFRNNPLLKKYPCNLELSEGYYRLTLGSRANDGSVTVRTTCFSVRKDIPQTHTLTLPKVENKLVLKGSIDMNTVVFLNDNSKHALTELSNKKGLMLCFADVGKEPSKHILQDLPKQQQALEAWGGGIVLLIPDDKHNPDFDVSAFRNLPKQTLWAIDQNRTILKLITETLQIDVEDNFPLTVYLSVQGGILYYSAGYRIGTGEDILKIIHQEKESLQPR